MEKNLELSLRHMQSNPTTGTPHNQQVISTQIETIFAVDALMSEIIKLSRIIEESNKQSEKLEESNYKLQVLMLILTGLGTAVVVAPVIGSIIRYLMSLISKADPTVLSTIITSLTSAVAGVATAFYSQEVLSKHKLTKVKDKLGVVLTNNLSNSRKRR